ncbi:sensor histidine kinase [Aurantibacillus circumpalustris]|uniref:sensor histidine kinase n=1 Tax=Aurantibacillus circumpalustris TaxID=3036359 RepID=UPI00295C05B4|nr:HAMP domain-containing sensor histidine kinase [Aurantibacillus circumpalustris]
MKLNKLNSVIALGLVAITGILVVQFFWTKQAFNNEGKKFSQTVHITLLQVVDRLYKLSDNEFPLKNPINKVANDYYIVNVNNDFDAQILEYCLKTEFERANLLLDFEYAIYKCESDEMVYGNYVSFHNKSEKKSSFHFPKQKNLVYYFAIRFPNETGYLIGSLKFWLVLSGILVLVMLIYVYSIFTILQQKKYSELQRDFINNMTHEFKTPLSSILIASNYLYKQEKIKNDEKLAKYTGIIIGQSNKLNSHIEKILNIAKSDSAPLTLDRKEIEILPLINDVIENIRLKHENLKVMIESSISEPKIYADEFHFTNLVYNVIDNAIKYCENSPELSICLTKEKNGLKLEFKDNGIGVSKKKIPFIFDKFYRIPNSRSNEVNGFGLGLYYVKKVCLLHGWIIKAFNNQVNGITLSLQIPQKQ